MRSSKTRSRRTRKRAHVIAIGGAICAGKDTLAEAIVRLAGRTVRHIRTSDALREIAREQKIHDPDNKILQEIYAELEGKEGSLSLIQRTCRIARQNPPFYTIINGLRHTHDLNTVICLSEAIAYDTGADVSFHPCFLYARPDIRFGRYNVRSVQRGLDIISRAQWERLEEDPCETGLEKLEKWMKRCYVDTSDFGLDEYDTLAEEILKKRK